MSVDRDDLIDQLLDEWEDAYEAGLNISAEELCADYPELLNDLREKIGILQTMEKRLASDSSDGTFKRRADDSFRVDSKYDDLEELNAGGLGVVYRAVDTELNRDVAVKFLRDPGQNQYLLEQFKAEAEITGRLDHPGVVPVYALGKAKSGEPFYSMRLIRGDSLDCAIREFHSKKSSMKDGARWIELRNLLSRFVSVCNTIAYAHQRGILHRDIKPHNIMLGKYGETLVVDWGLAVPFQRHGQFRVLDEKTLLPKKGEGHAESPDGHGTPAYMSPEQAAGDQQLDATSDIFSLGATLYKLLTGEIPFKGKNSIETKQLILQGEYKLPHQVDRRISKAISMICAKAMSHKKTERYTTALELAEDVERYLADEPVSPYREPIGRRLARWSRRNRGIAQWLTAAFVMAFAAAVVTLVAQYRNADELEKNRLELNQSLAESKVARENGVILATQLIANSIEFDLQNRFALLDQAAKRIKTAGLSIDNREDMESFQSMLEMARYDAECVAPSIAWFALDNENALISFQSDSEPSDGWVAETVQRFSKTSQPLTENLSLAQVSGDSATRIAVMLLPVDIDNPETTVIGMVIDLKKLSYIHIGEMSQQGTTRIRFVEVADSGVGQVLFDSYDKVTSDSKELFDWLASEVKDSSSPSVKNLEMGLIRSAIKIECKTARLETVSCSWYLVLN